MTLFEQPPPRPAHGPFDAVHRGRRLRRTVIGVVLAAIAIAAGVWWVTAGNGGSPIWSAKPPPEVIELADRGLLTEEARQLWYDASPRVMSRSIDRECGSSGKGADGPEFYGCYLPGPVRGAGRIVVYDPPDDRLAGWTLTPRCTRCSMRHTTS